MTYPSASTLRGFEPAFLDAMHQAMNAAAQPAHRPEDSPGHEPPRRTYAPPSQFDPLANHAANRRFLDSKDASVAKGEWQAAHQQLLRFCQEHGLADAAAELAHLTLEAAPLSKKTISVADCLRQDFKGALEALAQHVRDERIPMAARRQIVGGITDLSYCLQRQRAELRKAALELGAHLGGLRGEAGVAFVKLSAAHIQELLREEPRLKDQDVTTPHVWLPFAKVLRLPTLLVADAVDDHYSLDIRLYRDVVDRCAAALPRRIDSMAISDWLAGQCLDDAKAMLAEELCGMPPDFQQGAGHCDALERVLRQLALRYGPLSKFSFCQLDEDLLAQRLVDRPSMLAIDMRRKLEKEGVLPPADDRLLHQYTKDGNIHEVRLLEERPYVLVRPHPGSQPFLRPLDGLEANRLLQSAAGAGHRPGTPGPALDGKDRDHLRDHVVRQGLASQARTVALSHPTPERIGHVIEHVVLEDDTVAGWMGSHPEGWDAATLDRALHEILRCRHRAALGKLLSHWTGTGFPESWMRQVRRQAALGLDMALAHTTRVGEGLDTTVGEALTTMWNHIASQAAPASPDESEADAARRQALHGALTRSLLDSMVDMSAGYCDTGCVQRILYCVDGIDLSLLPAEPTAEFIRDEIGTLAGRVNNRFEALYGDSEADLKAKGEGVAKACADGTPLSAKERKLIARYQRQRPIDEQLVIQLKQDLLEAAVVGELVERRAGARPPCGPSSTGRRRS